MKKKITFTDLENNDFTIERTDSEVTFQINSYLSAGPFTKEEIRDIHDSLSQILEQLK